MFERAKENLSAHFAVFGLAERFDESLVLLKHRLGYESILYEEMRVAARPRAADVPPAVVRAAEAANEYDRELYRYAERLFERARSVEPPSTLSTSPRSDMRRTRTWESARRRAASAATR